MEFRITALLSSRNMKVRDFKSKISCCLNSECDVIEVVCVYVQCYLINMSASYSRIGAFYVTLEVDYFAMKNFPKKSLGYRKDLHFLYINPDFRRILSCSTVLNNRLILVYF